MDRRTRIAGGYPKRLTLGEDRAEFSLDLSFRVWRYTLAVDRRPSKHMTLVPPAILHRLGYDVIACEHVAHAIGRPIGPTFAAVIDGARPTVFLSRNSGGAFVAGAPDPRSCALLLVVGEADRGSLAARLRSVRGLLADDGMLALPSDTATRRWSLRAIAWARAATRLSLAWRPDVAEEGLKHSGLSRTVAMDPTRFGVRIHLGSYQPFTDTRVRDDIGRVVHDTSL